MERKDMERKDMERKDIERAKEIYEQISVLEEELKEMYGSHNRN